MTREEAIEYLNTLYMALAVFPNQQISLGNVDEMKESVSMAIQALSQEPCEWGRMTFDPTTGISEFEFSDGTIKQVKQAELEPCEDAVSREAVLEAVSEGCQEWRGIYGRCEELINALPSVTQKPIECDDAVSRQAVMKIAKCISKKAMPKYIDKLPSVTQKSGKWVRIITEHKCYARDDTYTTTEYKCSECGAEPLAEEAYDGADYAFSNYCPNCGARMVEPEERSDKE